MELQIEELLHKYHHCTHIVYSQVLGVFPRFDNWNRFEKFILLNLIILLAFFFVQLWNAFSIKGIKKSVSKQLFKLPFIKAKVQ
jgi:hypothetical protein